MLHRFAVVLVGFVVLGLPAGAWSDGGCPNEAVRSPQGSTPLPDCRAYEMVSPADKNGGSVSTNPMRTRSSVDGNAVDYSSASAAFGDVQGTGTNGVDYVAQRGPDGWFTHAITPHQEPPAFAFVKSSMYVGDMSSDLSKGVFLAFSPVLPGHPNVDRVANLYLRSDLLAGPPGSFQLLSDALAPVSPEEPFSGEVQIELDGASADFSHVIFESVNNLTAAASGSQPKLYEWVNGTVRLAGVLPDGSVPASSVAGRGVLLSQRTPNTISSDGSRIFFTVPDCGGFLCGGSALYMREDGERTVQLNASERAAPDPEGQRPAEFWGASADGSKAFLITHEKLTDDDTNPDSDLYMYDVNAPAGHHLTLLSVDSEPADGSNNPRALDVVGVSEDGSYVYFWGQNKLIPGQELVIGARNIFVWHNGTLRWIGAGENTGGNDPFWNEAYADLPDEARVTPDGKHLVFTTQFDQGLTGYSCPGAGTHCMEVYLYSFDSDSLVCASCNPTPTSAFLDTGFTQVAEIGSSAAFHTHHLNRSVSDDGSRVFFSTREALVAQDTNGRFDAYEYDAIAGRVHLISGGQSPSDSYFLEASAEGRDVFFTTKQPLAPADVDGDADLYDARVDGGFPVAPSRGCSSDECQGAPGAPPAFGAAASLSFSGQGNQVAVPEQPVKHAKKAKHKKRKRTHRKRKRKARKPGKSAPRRAGR